MIQALMLAPDLARSTARKKGALGNRARKKIAGSAV